MLHVVRDNTYKIRRGYLLGAMRALTKTCFDTEAYAKLLITEQDAVDTGALRASVYVNVENINEYDRAVMESIQRASRPGIKSGRARAIEHLPPVAARPFEGVVAVAAEYGIHVELGTRFMQPRPFLGPAAERAGNEFVENCRHMIDEEVR